MGNRYFIWGAAAVPGPGVFSQDTEIQEIFSEIPLGIILELISGKDFHHSYRRKRR
jgi:Na+/H+ antiporter NhaA